MALSYMHLAVALQTGEGCPWDTGRLLLGAIAPDAVHLRETYHPDDKLTSHLGQRAGKGTDEAILRFVKQYARGMQRDFVLGYAIHLLTDNLWWDEIFQPFCQGYTARGGDPEKRSRIYYRDADWFDYSLYQQPQLQAALPELARAKPEGLAGLMEAETVGLWRDRCLGFFDGGCEPSEMDYMAWANLEQFLHSAVRKCRAVFGDSIL